MTFKKGAIPIGTEEVGTVSSFSFTDLNGFTGVVTNPTTTPDLSIGTSVTGIMYGTGTQARAALAGDFPTLNQNTTGSAATLTTGRTLAITGDLAWTSPSFNGSANVTAAGTLATVNSNVGPFGSATQVASFTVNAKGLITAAAGVTVTPAIGSITGLGAGIAAALAAGTIPVANGGSGQTTYTNGQLLIGNTTGNTLTKATLSAGSGVSITNGAGSITIAAAAGSNSVVIVNTGNGHGSTNTKIRRFTTTQSSVGSDITYADSATLGASFTIVTDGVYNINYIDGRAGGTGQFGVSLNSAQLTTNIIAINAANRQGMTTAVSGAPGSFSITLRLSAADVLRPHTNGDVDLTSDFGTVFYIRKIGN